MLSSKSLKLYLKLNKIKTLVPLPLFKVLNGDMWPLYSTQRENVSAVAECPTGQLCSKDFHVSVSLSVKWREQDLPDYCPRPRQVADG